MTSADRPWCSAALFVFAAVSCTSAFAVSTQCRPGEDVLFSCHSGKKMVAVCASAGWSAQAGSLQYRFGPAPSAELVLPRDAGVVPSASATAGSLMFSGGGGATLRFSGGKVDYVVYSATSASWGDASGVVVERDGKTVRVLKCRGKVTSVLGDALFRDAGFRRDELPFKLPE